MSEFATEISGLKLNLKVCVKTTHCVKKSHTVYGNYTLRSDTLFTFTVKIITLDRKTYISIAGGADDKYEVCNHSYTGASPCLL